MGFDSTLVTQLLGNVYPCIIVPFLLLSSITFNNQNGVFFIVILYRIVYVTICLVVVTSFCTLSPDSPESCKLIIYILLHVCNIRNIQSSKVLYLPRIYFYILPGYYPPCFQHGAISPQNIFIYPPYRLCIIYVSNIINSPLNMYSMHEYFLIWVLHKLVCWMCFHMLD